MSNTIYQSTLRKQGPTQVKVTGDTYKAPWPDKQTGGPVYSVRVEVEGETKYYSTIDKKVADYLSTFRNQTVTIEAGDGDRVVVEGGESKPEQGKVTTEEVKSRYTGPKRKPAELKEKEAYWQRKEERDIEAQPKIQRAHSQEMAIRWLTGNKVEGVTAIQYDPTTLRQWIDWFQNDLENTPLPAAKTAEPKAKSSPERGEPDPKAPDEDPEW